MKLALIGGGGVRAPEFVRGALVFAAALDLQELWLMDIDPTRLEIIVPLCEEVVRQAGSPFRLYYTTSLEEALRDANFIVTTIRVGGEHGRVIDERVALRHNVLGQETTGAGGFSMALRSIPILIEVATRTETLAPKAWTFNFTNPAGLVAQALQDAGFRRIVGICDSANTGQQEIARYLGVSVDEVKAEVFGLNHLSWMRKALVKGVDVLPALLNDDAFVQSTNLRFFDMELVRHLGMFLNEYLFYYYHRDDALKSIQAEHETRGEEVERLNKELFESLRGCPPAEALRLYDVYNRRRSSTYMAYAEPKSTDVKAETQQEHVQQEVGGYAGVALRAALALTQDRPLRIGLNVPNQGAIPGMQLDDVVEITCEVDAQGIRPLSVESVPEHAYLLMRAVKRYERLASRAILNRDRALAIESLFAHPLVGSYSLARTLVDEYLEAHRSFVGEWH
jgi:6-phospho-beta-glucosidase